MDDNKIQHNFFLIDDDVFILNIYKQYLKNLGYTNVATYENGLIAINHLNDKPDIIFLDHEMDYITGLEVLKKIKRVDPNIYVVMLTAQNQIKIAVDTLKYGAFDYIVKDENVQERMQNVINKIELVEDELRKANPSLLRKIISKI